MILENWKEEKENGCINEPTKKRRKIFPFHGAYCHSTGLCPLLPLPKKRKNEAEEKKNVK